MSYYVESFIKLLKVAAIVGVSACSIYDITIAFLPLPIKKLRSHSLITALNCMYDY